MTMKTKGLIQALGVAGYCAIIGTGIFNINKIIGKAPGIFGPASFLLLFSFSALVCALLVFYKPYLLFFDGKKKEAINLVVSTTAWLFGFLIIFLTLAILLK